MSEIIFVDCGSQKERFLEKAYENGFLMNPPEEITSSVTASDNMRSFKISEHDVLLNPLTIQLIKNMS